jgi:hypothetical protein
MPRWDTSNEALRKAVHWAMLDAWLWTAKKNLRGAAISPPPDFVREGGEIKFRPSVFADRVAELLLQRGFKSEWADDEESGDNVPDAPKAAAEGG